MPTGKQPRHARIAPPEPIVIDVLRLRDLRAPREEQFIVDVLVGVVRPEGLDDEPDAAVGWEAPCRGGVCRG